MKMLNRFEPSKLPIAKSAPIFRGSLSKELIETISSGRLVMNARKIRPITTESIL